MKTRTLQILTFLAALALFATIARSQTNPPAALPPGPDVINTALSAVPTVPLADETIGVTVGTLMDGASSFKNAEIIDWSPIKSIFIRAEIVNSAAAGSVIESAGAGFGVAKTWQTAKVYGFLEGRRNWSSAAWEGVGGLGLAYAPAAMQTNSVLQNFSGVIEQRLVITKLKDAPPTETLFGIRYSF